MQLFVRPSASVVSVFSLRFCHELFLILGVMSRLLVSSYNNNIYLIYVHVTIGKWGSFFPSQGNSSSVCITMYQAFKENIYQSVLGVKGLMANGIRGVL